MADRPTEFDYIVVGGGTAGVPIASRLSSYLPSSHILLLEAGPNAISHPKVTEPSTIFELIPEGLLVDYSTTPQKHCNNRQIVNLAGRMLSGSSGANVGVWMRASSTDYDLIAERAGHERFSFKEMVKYFKRAETWWDAGADSEYHGFEGPLHTVGGRKYPLRPFIQKAVEQLGYKYNPDAAKGDPSGLVEMTQCFRATSDSSSERQHSARVYDLTKVDVRCESPVAKILLDEEKRATGVELVSGERLFARKEIIVSCGAQRTPQLLMLSGIGPRDELEKQEIQVQIDAPLVGKNLFDHACITQYYKLKDPSKGFALPFEGTMRPEYGQGFPWEFNLFSHISPSRLAPVLAADKEKAIVGTDGEQHPHLRDRRCHIMHLPFYFPILANMNQYNPDVVIGDGKHIAITALSLLPLSRGTVTLRSSNPTDTPVCDPKFMSTESDRFILRTAIRTTLALVSTPPFADVLDGETPPADSRFPALTMESTDQEIDERVKEHMQTIAHPMGTCALGDVLDSEFRVRRVKGGNLRVCDASVFPEPLGGMPSCTIYALAELCADLIAGRS
ncbi:alcohol oxidase [Paraphaeosphaeria sporulosa]|uniref:Alcohol oxidase n=1 Tax=Paraphaeosphaeria sporulosa TaxID=1460663 RepID=A0A177CKK0_9PLEO|nr:alcohol oxidase [Paraphaeosphaeria sporulosa]OAG07761.1 alcohol oxidase [Paraphaeosphaeria sporulosa]